MRLITVAAILINIGCSIASSGALQSQFLNSRVASLPLAARDLPTGTCNADTPCSNKACCSKVSLPVRTGTRLSGFAYPPILFPPSFLRFNHHPLFVGWTLWLFADILRRWVPAQLRCQSRVRTVCPEGKPKMSAECVLFTIRVRLQFSSVSFWVSVSGQTDSCISCSL